MDRLAIIIPFYKIDFFEETLRSVAHQTNKNFRLYIGNDLSKNDPKPLIDQHFGGNDYEYFNYPENLGGKNLALQWERILSNVKEEWFQILGDDDLLKEDFVEEFYHSLPVLNRSNINVLKFPIKIINEENTCVRAFSFEKEIIDRNDFLISRIEHSSLSSLSENIFRTKAYQKFKIQHFALAWHSDDCMIYEFAENHNILYNKNTSVLVRMSSINISSKTDNAEVKISATNDFYNYIIAKYYKNFNRNQQSIILSSVKKHYYYSRYSPTLKSLYTVAMNNILDGVKLSKYLFK